MPAPLFCNQTDLNFPVVLATYQVETSQTDSDKVAGQIAIGQTVGTWKAQQMEALSDWMARVVSVEIIGVNPSTQESQLEIQVAFPLQTVQSDFGALLTVLFGKLSMAGKVRLTDIQFPEEWTQRFTGPRYGVSGIRQLVNEPDSPLLMSIFKPCLGIAPEDLGQWFYQQAMGGIHLVKDDEILSDMHLDSAFRRLEACLTWGEKARQETEKTTLYVINLTGPAEELLERARALSAAGAQALLFNYLSYGLPMLAALCQDSQVNIPLVAHPSLAGAFYGSPAHGISPQVLLGKLPRMAGADLLLFPSPYGSVALPKPDAMAIAHALVEPVFNVKPTFPVPSAGITEAMIPQLVSDFGKDCVINVGTGIHDHPEGSAQGARVFQQKMRQVLEGVPVSGLVS